MFVKKPRGLVHRTANRLSPHLQSSYLRTSLRQITRLFPTPPPCHLQRYLVLRQSR